MSSRRPAPEEGNNIVVKRPDVASMFHPTLNQRTPETYTPWSNLKAWWLCPADHTHVWEAAVSDISRASKKSRGCPFCSAHAVTLTTSLLYNYPELAKEFDEAKNGCNAAEVSKHSRKTVWWKCIANPVHTNCAAVLNRAAAGSSCPYCVGCKPTSEYNFEILFPDLAKEFDTKLNVSKPCDYLPYSGRKVYWRCNKCDNVWNAVLSSRSCGAGCPRCSRQGYSRSQIEWLESLQSEENYIAHGTNGGEALIPGVGKVDGYCSSTNTVYEYHGDFWHGRPGRFCHDKCNPVNKKSYGRLYHETLVRDRLILSLGYKLVVRWETDYPEYTRLLCPRFKVVLSGRQYSPAR